MSGIINCATYSDGRRVANIQIEEIGQALGERNGFIWIGLHEPSAELLKQIQSEFRLHELAIEDAHRAHQRPKLEAYGDTLFIVLRTAQMNQELRQIEFGETHFFVGCNFYCFHSPWFDTVLHRRAFALRKRSGWL